MSLRTDYTGAYDTKVAEARAAGSTSILTTNLATITSEMATAAGQGLQTFTVNGFRCIVIDRGDFGSEYNC